MDLPVAGDRPSPGDAPPGQAVPVPDMADEAPDAVAGPGAGFTGASTSLGREPAGRDVATRRQPFPSFFHGCSFRRQAFRGHRMALSMTVLPTSAGSSGEGSGTLSTGHRYPYTYPSHDP